MESKEEVIRHNRLKSSRLDHKVIDWNSGEYAPTSSHQKINHGQLCQDGETQVAGKSANAGY